MVYFINIEIWKKDEKNCYHHIKFYNIKDTPIPLVPIINIIPYVNNVIQCIQNLPKLVSPIGSKGWADRLCPTFEALTIRAFLKKMIQYTLLYIKIQKSNSILSLPLKGLSFDKVFSYIFLHLFLSFTTVSVNRKKYFSKF